MIDRRLLLLGFGLATYTPRLEAAPSADAIYELRNYLLRPGQRDTLITLFEREFIESQEAVGAHIPGIFRDLDAPDHFVWLRSFADMAARAAALNAFYRGPVWRANSAAANATMIDSDDVYLLRRGARVLAVPEHRPPLHATTLGRGMFVADVFTSTAETESEFERRAAANGSLLASFVTEGSPNNFPALPVHAESVFVTLRHFDIAGNVPPMAGMPPASRTLRLQATARSLLR